MPNKDIQVIKGARVNDAPRVSIIIPAYNVADYIAEALDSVFAQTYTDYEVIVINDGSPDTPEFERVLKEYRSRIVYAKQKNRGVSGARNTGLRLARSEFVALLDPDDIWLPNYLAAQMKIIGNDPMIAVVYANAIVFGNKIYDGRECMDLFPSEGEVTFERLVLQQCSVLVSVVARRKAIIEAGLFDESLHSSEDFDLWLRIVKNGGRIVYHRQVLHRYRSRPDSLSADPVWMCDHFLQVLAKAEQTMELTKSEHQSLLEGKVRVQAIMRLAEGKSAFFNGNSKAAIAGLADANKFFKSPKISLLIQFLRVAPQFLLRLYNLRDRFIFKTDTKFIDKRTSAESKI